MLLGQNFDLRYPRANVSGAMASRPNAQGPPAPPLASGGMRQMREVGAHDLPLAAAFDEDQRCAAVHDPHLAIFRHPGERVISVGNPGIVVKDPTGKLPKVECAGSQPTRRSLEKLHKLLLVIKAIGD